MIVRIGLCLLFCFLAVHAMAEERIAQVDVSLDPVAGTLAVTIANTGGPYGFKKYTVGPFSEDQADDHVLISEDGSFVPPKFWWSVLKLAPGPYVLTISAPPGQVAVTSATMVEERQSADGYQAVFVGRFEAGLPTIFAGPYDVSEIERRNTRLRTYFHAEPAALSALYLAQSADYLDDYAREIGAYPHPEFAMISAPVEFGLGFPGIAYLNRDALPLPFMRTRALAHEVLHNWWGNGVQPDFDTGNWAEGLTTYMADYRLAEKAGRRAARDMRREWLHDLDALPEAYDVPVRAFVAQGHGASAAIGYSKVAMIFHMLRREVGDPAFAAFVKRLWHRYAGRTASWNDVFRTALGRKYRGSFSQWIDRGGAPDLVIEQADIKTIGNKWRLTLWLRQTGIMCYALKVPVAIKTEAGVYHRNIRLKGGMARKTFDIDHKPLALAIDPDVHLLRHLAAGEAVPIMAEIATDDQAVLVVVGNELRERAEAFASAVLRRDIAAISWREAADRPAMVIGLTDALAAADLSPVPLKLENRGSALAWAARRNDGAPLLIIAADDLASLQALERSLPIYLGRSYVVFDGSTVVDNGLWPPSANHALRRTFD